MVDFSTVSLRILSPDGKTVLAELQGIDQTGQRAGRSAEGVGRGIGKSVGSVRALSSAMQGATGDLRGAAIAAGELASHIALSTKNAKLATSAIGIGAIVGIGVELYSVWKAATKQMEDWNTKMNAVGNDTAVLQLQGISFAKDYEAKKQQIIIAGQKELATEEQIANAEERKAYNAAIYKRIREGTRALDRQTAREARVASANELAVMQDRNRITAGELAYPTDSREQKLAIGHIGLSNARNEAIRKLTGDAAEKHFTKDQVDDLMKEIETEFDHGVQLLNRHLEDEAQKVGDKFTESLAGSISDGITAAIQSGNIGAGFKALTGGILIGLGNMMEEIGTQSLVAAKLMVAIVNALRAFAPEGAIGPALLLIAAGAALKGVGQSMGGGGGGGSRGGYGGGYSLPSTTYVGVLNPSPAPNTAGLSAATPVVVHATIIGKDDPSAQRQIMELFARAQRRGSTSG